MSRRLYFALFTILFLLTSTNALNLFARPLARGFKPALAPLLKGSATPPIIYDAVSDQVARSKPPLPALGPAGSLIVDPTFGARILRVTDAQTQSDMLNRAYNTPSSAEQNAWNATSDRFYIEDRGGRILFYDFTAHAMKVSRTTDDKKQGSSLTFFSSQMRPSPTFSYSDRDIIYGVGGVNGRTIRQYDFKKEAFTDLLNLDAVVPGLRGTTGDPSVSVNEKLCTYFGGSVQDQHYLVVVFDKSTGQYSLLNTLNSTIDGQPSDAALGFTIHNARIDRSGRFVTITRAATGMVVVWDHQTNTVSGMSVSTGGHRVSGYGYTINQSGDDGAQYQIRSLEKAGLSSPATLIKPRLSPQNWNISTHGSWNNAQPDVLVPVIQSQYRTTAVSSSSPWRAWDDEIIAIRTDSAESKVWRFAHHRSDYLRYRQFYDTPRVNVAPDGRYAIFTSNWENTLGNQPAGNLPRQDVFLIELKGSDASNPAESLKIINVNVTSITSFSAVVTWETNYAADGQIQYGTSADDTALLAPYYWALLTSHSFGLYGLEPKKAYHLKLKSKDAAGNIAESADITFTTRTLADATPPVISGVSISTVTDGSATIRWVTDELADSQVEYGTTAGLGISTATSPVGGTSHSVTLSGLAPGTTYYYRAKSKDAIGNSSASNVFTFTTGAGSGSVSGMSVTWINLIGCSVNVGQLKKTRGADGASDAGAISQQSLPAGSNGYLEFVAAEKNKIRFIGLTSDPLAGPGGTDWRTIDFAIKLSNNSMIAIYENGVWKAQSTYDTGDKLRIAVEEGKVRYYKNGMLIYTSIQSPGFPLMVDASLLHTQATINNAVFSVTPAAR